MEVVAGWLADEGNERLLSTIFSLFFLHYTQSLRFSLTLFSRNFWCRKHFVLIAPKESQMHPINEWHATHKNTPLSAHRTNRQRHFKYHSLVFFFSYCILFWQQCGIQGRFWKWYFIWITIAVAAVVSIAPTIKFTLIVPDYW